MTNLKEPYPGYSNCAAYWREMKPKIAADLDETLARITARVAARSGPMKCPHCETPLKLAADGMSLEIYSQKETHS